MPSWTLSLGDLNEEGYSLAVDISGNLYLTGFTISSSITFDTVTFPFPAGGKNALFIIKYDPLGNILCSSELASGGVDKNEITTDAFGNTYICGNFAGVNPLIVGDNNLSLTALSGGSNFFLGKYSCCDSMKVGISENVTILAGEKTTLSVTGTATYRWTPSLST